MKEPLGKAVFEVPFESHESSEENNKIIKIESCRISLIKAIIFFTLSLTLIPLLIYKWFPKIRRFLLYVYSDLANATHFIVYGPGTIFPNW